MLPFENLGDSADAYFADGVTDEVRGKLTQVPGLEVIARGSSSQYRGTTKRPAEIARELGVDYLLTGTVRWEKARGRREPGAGEPGAGGGAPGAVRAHPLGQQFDAALTDVFQVQADIADQVADALDVALADSVRAGLAARPTANLEAYDAFLKGEAASASMTRHGSAERLAGAAVLPARRGRSTRAFCRPGPELSQSYSAQYANVAPTAELAAQAAAAAERARRLGPSRPESYLAQGTYERLVLKDNAASTGEPSRRASKLAPSNVVMIVAMSGHRADGGQLGRRAGPHRAGSGARPAIGHDATRRALFLLYLRRYPEAEIAHRRAESLAPTSLTIIHQGAMLALAQGDRARAERIARTPPPGVDPMELAYTFARFEELGVAAGRRAAAPAARRWAPTSTREIAATGDWSTPSSTPCGESRRSRGPTPTRPGSPTRRPSATAPDDGQLHALLRPEPGLPGPSRTKRIREGERGVELRPIEKDAYFGPYVQLLLARVHMMVGSKDKAVELLEPLVEVPNNLSKAWLRVDPTFDPLRSHPRFQALVGGTS